MNENETKVVIANSQVFMHFTVELLDGTVADNTREHGKPARVTLSDGSLSEAFEKALLGLSPKDKKRFTLEAKDAFGESNPDNIRHMNRNDFAADLKLEKGLILSFDSMDGNQYPGMIVDVLGDSVTVDFNHPLSSKSVVFDVEILDVIN